MRLLAALLLPAVVALGIAYAGVHLVGRTLPSLYPNVKVTGIAWGGRVFTNRRDFARWLGSRGSSYKAWARRHPGRAAQFAKRKVRGAHRIAAASSHTRHTIRSRTSVAAQAGGRRGRTAMFSFSVVGGILISGVLLLLFLRVRRRSRILLPSQIGAGSARRAREGLLISAGRASHAVAAAPPLGARAPSAGRVGIVRSAERTLRASTRAASAVAIASRRHREFRWYVGATMITVFVTYVMTLVAR